MNGDALLLSNRSGEADALLGLGEFLREAGEGVVSRESEHRAEGRLSDGAEA
jgi:hypothetical protein